MCYKNIHRSKTNNTTSSDWHHKNINQISKSHKKTAKLNVVERTNKLCLRKLQNKHLKKFIIKNLLNNQYNINLTVINQFLYTSKL